MISKNGFGFIEQEGLDSDVFFHACNIDGNFDDVKMGDDVVYDLVDGDRGLKAINIEIKKQSQ